MSNTFTKTSLRGFTLIELLVVIAIIGLLSTVIAAPITQARKKGRDGKKVADLHQIQGSLQQYADDHVGNYPPDLGVLVPVYLANIPPFAIGGGSGAPAKDKYMYTAYVALTSSTTVGFHLGSKLEAASLALSDDRDCAGSGIISGATPNYCIDSSVDGSTNISGRPGNYTGHAWGGAGTDYSSDEKVGGGAVLDDSTNKLFPTIVGYSGSGSTEQYDFGGGSDTADQTVTPCSAVTYQANSAVTNKPACVYDITN